ncbi:MAG: benzodiazapine receptor [Polaribacter sp.]|jgi:benzodiazapine receptor
MLIFLVINFAALGLGGFFTTDGVTSEWYATLNKAPWTPPGWVFGAAWSMIMICFSIYMAYAWKAISNQKTLIGLFVLQWILNVVWNPVFFKFHSILPALIIISTLTLLVGYFLFGFRSSMKEKALLVLPYFLWLLIATSLNGYALLYN